jgi:hypothetical protein
VGIAFGLPGVTDTHPVAGHTLEGRPVSLRFTRNGNEKISGVLAGFTQNWYSSGVSSQSGFSQ